MIAAGKKWLWTAVAILIAWGFVAASLGGAVLPPLRDAGGSDVVMYSAITARVAAGENYYRVLADELPARGYAIRPLLNWRLPTLTWINAIPPSRVWGRALLVAVGCAVIILWWIAIKRRLPRAVLPGVPVVLFATAPLLPMGASVVFYEIWAGLFIAASLATFGLGRWKWSVALGGAALFIRELALPYVLIMAAVAWLESRRQEAVAWLTVVALFAAYWGWHAWQVLQVIPPNGLVNRWAVAGGWGFVLEASNASIFLMLLPERASPWLVSILVPLLWAGCWHWSDALGRRLALVLTGYYALFMIVGRPDNWYWGFVIAPLIPLGALGYLFRSTRPLNR